MKISTTIPHMPPHCMIYFILLFVIFYIWKDDLLFLNLKVVSLTCNLNNVKFGDQPPNLAEVKLKHENFDHYSFLIRMSYSLM